MSSCWTFRLNRRKAFSRGSPSCNLTSAKNNDTSQLTLLDHVEFCSLPGVSQEVSCSKKLKKCPFCWSCFETRPSHEPPPGVRLGLIPINPRKRALHFQP